MVIWAPFLKGFYETKKGVLGPFTDNFFPIKFPVSFPERGVFFKVRGKKEILGFHTHKGGLFLHAILRIERIGGFKHLVPF